MRTRHNIWLALVFSALIGCGENDADPSDVKAAQKRIAELEQEVAELRSRLTDKGSGSNNVQDLSESSTGDGRSEERLESVADLERWLESRMIGFADDGDWSPLSVSELNEDLAKVPILCAMRYSKASNGWEDSVTVEASVLGFPKSSPSHLTIKGRKLKMDWMQIWDGGVSNAITFPLADREFIRELRTDQKFTAVVYFYLKIGMDELRLLPSAIGASVVRSD